ncbi:MAG TPA: TPM domain-containing protein [Saprospiraceae bacterium]|nr:TPM domain-containing protein [Saprospiraceae bacterium]
MNSIFNVFFLVGLLVMISCNSNGQNAKSSSNQNSTSSSQRPAQKFHACNYDGSEFNSQISQMNATQEGEAVVEKILSFTGLPQNFTVKEGDVPNAAAIILQDPDGVLRRYILYNRDFMQMVDDRTKNNWAGISILAHEIGHHLSGHTLLAGGSQPSIELEADKFSGYVLYKMGAKLQESQVAMKELASDEDGDTHPGKSKRLVAIQEGWNQACKQSKGDCNGSDNKPAEPILTQSNPQEKIEQMKPELPKPKENSIPLKFDRFVYDEAGLLTNAQNNEFSEQLQNIAKSSGAEIVVLCPKSLGGMSPSDYCQKMIEKMRIGKMDLANGGVILIAEGKVAFYVMPGLYWVFGQNLLQSTLDDMVNAVNEAEPDEKAYQAIRYGMAAIDVHLNSGVMKWQIDYPNLAAAKKDGELAVRKITRVVGTVTSTNTGNFVGEGIIRMTMKLEDGTDVYVHVQEGFHANIQQGQKYAVVGRLYDMKYGVTLEALSFEAMK